jgi:hypothetical protein
VLLSSAGVAVGRAPVDPGPPEEVPGGMIPPAGGLSAGRGPAKAFEIPIATATIEKAIGNFMGERNYNGAALKSTDFAALCRGKS